MDIIKALSSLNKITIVAFILTLGFLLFEFYSFRKERQKKERVSSIPDFNPNHKVLIKPAQAINVEPVVIRKNPVSLSPIKTAVLSGTTIVMTLTIAIIGFKLAQQKETKPAVLKTKAAEIATVVTITPSPINSDLIGVKSEPISPFLAPTKILPKIQRNQLTPSVSPITPTPIQSSSTPTPTPTITVPTITKPTTLPVSGVSEYSIFFIAVASLIILVSFLY